MISEEEHSTILVYKDSDSSDEDEDIWIRKSLLNDMIIIYKFKLLYNNIIKIQFYISLRNLLMFNFIIHLYFYLNHKNYNPFLAYKITHTSITSEIHRDAPFNKQQ
jgi:hypothetical protein